MTGKIVRKVAWIHVEGRALLCVRSHGKDLFYIPGGKPEAAESCEAALIREISEELGVAIIPETIIPACSFSAPADGKPGLTVAVDAYQAEHAGEFLPNSEIAEYRFMSSAEAGKVSAVTRAIIAYLNKSNAID